MWDLSCRDWEARIREGRTLIPDLPLFKEEADVGQAFYDNLILPDVAGQPLLRDASGQWFRDIVRALFGSRDPSTNVRHIREIFVLAPKGSSKTSYSAALMIVALLMNVRSRVEYLLVAPSQATADMAFGQAVGMIEADETLKKRFHPREHLKQIDDRTNGARLKIKTFDLKIMTGTKPAGVLLDELHLLGKEAKADKVLVQIRGGLTKNSDGFLITTSTQSDGEPTGVFRTELARARAIRDGEKSGTMLPVLYEFPRAIAKDVDQWSDPANWPMVMPNLGRPIKLEDLIPTFEEARDTSEHELRVWASQHLNLEIGIGGGAGGWIGGKYWLKRADEALSKGTSQERLQQLLDRCEVVVVGIDGGGMDDLLGLAVLGREKVTRKWLLWTHAWCHDVVLEERKSIASKLLDLEKSGDLTIIRDEDEGDIEGLADIIEMIRDAGLLPEENGIGVDPSGVDDIVDELIRRGFTRTTEEAAGLIVGVRQGFTLQNAVKVAERRLAKGHLLHDGNPLISWCVGNAKQEQKGNSKMITKQAAGVAKIDPLMATFDTVHLMSMNPEAARVRSYLASATELAVLD